MKRIIQTIVILAALLTSIPSLALEAPALRITISGLDVSLSWTPVSCTTVYKLYYAPSPYTGTDTIKNIDMGTSRSFSATLWEGAAYYVAVTAIDGSEESEYSNIEQFTLSDNQTVCVTDDYTPVCGVDGNTYSNTCYVGIAGVQIDYQGECVKCDSDNLNSCATSSECSVAGGNWIDNKCDEVAGDGSGNNFTPPWLNQMIDEFENDPLTNPPRIVTQYLYNESIVFHISSPCCDQLNYLYDITGDIVCAPDGGITGSGDGQCTDFEMINSSASILWEDPRNK